MLTFGRRSSESVQAGGSNRPGVACRLTGGVPACPATSIGRDRGRVTAPPASGRLRT
jgi:hypothetical protein